MNFREREDRRGNIQTQLGEREDREDRREERRQDREDRREDRMQMMIAALTRSHQQQVPHVTITQTR